MEIITILSGLGAGEWTAIVGSAATALGAIATLTVKLISIHKTNKIEREARLQKEKENFYYLTATNLVLSAERLNLTGAQKKEYVMTWLENEAIKSNIVVDKTLMSTAIEHVILIMNDHRNLDMPIDKALKEAIEKRVETDKDRKLKELAEEIETTNGLIETAKTNIVKGATVVEKTASKVKAVTEKTSDLIKELEE